MYDIVDFLQHHDYKPKTPELEALLRRCDHDSDRAFSFEEFCEITDFVDTGEEEEEEEDPNKAVEEYRAQKREIKSRRYECIGRLISFTQDKVTEYVNLDLQKKLLKYHATFSARALFEAIDKRKRNYILASDLQKYFSKQPELDGYDWPKLIALWATEKGSDRLTLFEFEQGINPYSGQVYRGGYAKAAEYYQPHNPHPGKPSKEQKECLDKASARQLIHVLHLSAIVAKRRAGDDPEDRDFQVMEQEDAVELWQEIDRLSHGHVTAGGLQKWFEDAANFTLPMEDTHYLYDVFGAAESLGRISEGQFISTLSRPGRAEK